MTACKHPKDLIRKVDTGTWMCACGARWATIDWLKWDGMPIDVVYGKPNRVQVPRLPKNWRK